LPSQLFLFRHFPSKPFLSQHFSSKPVLSLPFSRLLLLINNSKSTIKQGIKFDDIFFQGRFNNSVNLLNFFDIIFSSFVALNVAAATFAKIIYKYSTST
jgi:hypothetical protein